MAHCPPGALIRKIPFSFFPDFWVWVTSEARGSVSVGFLGSCQLSLFGGGPTGGLYRPPPPPGNENPASPMQQALHISPLSHVAYDVGSFRLISYYFDPGRKIFLNPTDCLPSQSFVVS